MSIFTHAVIPTYLFLCVLLGGATRAGYLQNIALQLLALPIIVASLMAVRRTSMSSSARSLLIIATATLVLMLIQLIPLPPALWAVLPGRTWISAGYELLRQPLPWLPISLAPEKTLANLCWLLPPLAVLLGVIRLGAFRTRWIAWSILAAAVSSVALGALQVSGGAAFYLYSVTNFGKAVGFFANANHEGTLLLVAIPFLAGIVASAPQVQRGRHKRSDSRLSGMLLVGSALAVLAAGLLINRSLAGWGLALPVAGASYLLVQNASTTMRRVGLGVLGSATLAVTALIFLDPLGGTVNSEDERASVQSRYTSITTTLAAGVDYMPLGSGVGSFAEIYRTREEPATVAREFMNHAHSDYAELFLEVGIPGLLLLLVFLLWWLRQALTAWAQEGEPFARAASIASAAILVHSLVDYPIRTAAISTVFAACCALMTAPRERSDIKRNPHNLDRPRHLTA